MDLDFRGQVWKRVWEMTIFLVWNRVSIWRTGRLPATNPQEYPPPTRPRAYSARTLDCLALIELARLEVKEFIWRTVQEM